jgi:general secretion pathway protein H
MRMCIAGSEQNTKAHQSSWRSRQPVILAAGFTLVELLVVLVLISILMSITSPSIGRTLSAVKLRTASREIAATIRFARWKAIREQQLYWIQIDTEKNEIELASQDLKYHKLISMPDGISIIKASLLKDQGTPDPQKSSTYFFMPNGLSDSFQVVISTERGLQLKVFQDVLTGSPRIEQLPSETEG